MVVATRAGVESKFVRPCHQAISACWEIVSDNIRAMKVNVVVKPKEAVLDPQGVAVRDAMRHLGMPEVRSVRIGKFMEIEVEGNSPELEEKLHGLCRDLLSNPVIEDYEWQKSEVSDGRAEVGKKK
jgi:phosphoribosylformylglycinamidine synthase subunit PurS